MLLVLALIFAVLWLLGFVVYHTASFAIHILLILAVISLVIHLVRALGGPRPTRTIP